MQVELKAIEAKLLAWHRADALSRRLRQILGAGLVTVAALVMKVRDPHAFRPSAPPGCLQSLDHFHGRKDLARQDHSRRRREIAQLLVLGATSVVKQAKAKGRALRWLLDLLKRKTPKLGAVALARCLAS